MGSSRYRASRPLPWRTDTATVEEEAELPPGRQLLKQTIKPLSTALYEWVERIRNGGAGRRPGGFNLLSQVKPDEAAYLIARIAVNAAANRLTATATAFQISNALIDHIEMLNLKRANKKGYKGLEAKLKKGAKRRSAIRDIMEKEGAKVDFSEADKLQAGMRAIELLCDSTTLFTLDTMKVGRGETFVLRPTEACSTWLEKQHARCEILEPIHLPMVVRPRRWRTPFWGGYLTKRPGLRLVKQWAAPYHSELRYVDMPEVYAAVNAVQETPWRINRRVLDVMREVWDQGGSLGGLPRRDDLPMPTRPEDIETNELARAAWKREAAKVYERNNQALSKRLAFSQRLWIADKFRDETAIYFPHELDFRGRIYPIPIGGPHPQADDSGKGLLEFANGMPLGDAGGWWLAVHIANLFGVDKVSFQDRIDWVFANTNAILDSADDPLDGERFWTKADSPYCALAACFEWAGYMREGATFVSHIPVALDGSNSGLQHFSAMLRDPVGARAVNLLPVDKPQDVYSEVAKLALEAALAANDNEAQPWKLKGVSRKIAKRPTMTYCYSATRYGMQDMVLQTLKELDKEAQEEGKPPYLEGADNYAAANWLSFVLWDAIGETVNAASGAMAWLRAAAKVAAKAGQPIWWTTPVGLPVLQAYRKVTGQRLDVHYQGRRLQLQIAKDTDKLDANGQTNGIAPNFVHSNDAAHLMATVNACVRAGITDLAVIHDSFGTHAANANRLSLILRETFIAQYTPDVLARFRDELVAQLPPEVAAELPELPPMGDLDLEVLRDAEYMFA
ncbi:DNA-directed RNA polymerase [Caulobacter segnis]|uniref:DNA-directed RNA polymerase n=1 Tax=Caulobacter segnis TaxID=88688 RepID=UPI0026E98F22|nr:DNA-directed RNA polymerase [Caulobacter segnis]